MTRQTRIASNATLSRTQIISVEMSGTGNIAEDVSLARLRNQRVSVCREISRLNKARRADDRAIIHGFLDND